MPIHDPITRDRAIHKLFVAVGHMQTALLHLAEENPGIFNVRGR